MNKALFNPLKTTMCFLILISSQSFSQVKNVEFLRAGAADGVKIVQAYMAPWTNAFGAGLNGSWYNTAKTHKFGGFDITTSINVGFVPSSAQTYNVADLGLTTLTGSGTASTVAGPDKPGPSLTKTVNGIDLASFTLPPGTGWKMIPVPTAQIGIGLPLGTELKFRFIPKITIKGSDISLWGVGLMHNIMQYIPGNKLSPFDVSLFGGYTRLQGNVPIRLLPDPGTPANYTTFTNPGSFVTQKMEATVQAWTVSVVGSFNIPVVTFYGGLGYSKTQTRIVLKGYYPTPVFVATPAPGAEYNDSGVISGNEIPSVNIKNFSGLRTNVGVRFKLSVITLNIDYTWARYNVVSLGLGISFR
jgi:hypothetical protein